MAENNESDVVTSTNNNQREDKEIIETKISGVVKWFNVKRGFGFIQRSDTEKDLFVHQTSIVADNPRSKRKSVGEQENVQFDVGQGSKGLEAVNVTGPDGGQLQGSQYTNRFRNRPRYRNRSQSSNQEVGRSGRPRRAAPYSDSPRGGGGGGRPYNNYGNPGYGAGPRYGAPPPRQFYYQGGPRPRRPPYYAEPQFYYRGGPPMGAEMGGPPMNRYPPYGGNFRGPRGPYQQPPPMPNYVYSPRERGDSYGQGGRRRNTRRRTRSNKQADELADGMNKMSMNDQANNQAIPANA